MFGVATATQTPLFGLPLGQTTELIPMSFVAGGAFGGAIGVVAARRGGSVVQGALWGGGVALFGFLLLKTLSG